MQKVYDILKMYDTWLTCTQNNAVISLHGHTKKRSTHRHYFNQRC
jgi:hypothetical protein